MRIETVGAHRIPILIDTTGEYPPVVNQTRLVAAEVCGKMVK
jgi:hypothetical protein